MNLIKNQYYEATITGYTSEGDGVCKINDQVVFVPNCVIGDFSNIKIIKTTKNISYGIVDEVFKPSPNRTKSECHVSNKCGGCSLWHMNYTEELEFKRKKVQDAIKRIAKIDFNITECVASDLEKKYRNKAQYPVRQENGKAVFGFYRKNSHDIVRNNNCLIQTDKSNEIAKFIVDFMNEHSIWAYNEEKNNGFIRHIYIRTGFDTNEVFLTLVSTTFSIPKMALLSEQLQQNFPEIVGCCINKNGRKTNLILGKEYKTIFGKPTLNDVLCGNKFNISPDSFYQVNRKAAENLYNKAIEFANFNGNERVLDMYCGAGTITLAISKHVLQATGIEIMESAIKNAKINAEINGISNVDFIVGDASVAVKQFENENIDIIFVDPPRKGLDSDTISSIIKISPKKIVYVSCDPATLARDIKVFSENGFVLENAIAFDLFPRTSHVESVVSMARN